MEPLIKLRISEQCKLVLVGDVFQSLREIIMERQLSVLKHLLKDSLDRVGVIHNLNKLKVEYDHEAPFVILKYKLQLEILEIIIKENANSVYYSKLKKETEDYLEFHNQRLKKTDFKCCLAGCLFHCRKHRDYIRHLKRFHSKETNFIWNWFCYTTLL